MGRDEASAAANREGGGLLRLWASGRPSVKKTLFNALRQQQQKQFRLGNLMAFCLEGRTVPFPIVKWCFAGAVYIVEGECSSGVLHQWFIKSYLFQ